MHLTLGATTRPWHALPFATACAHIAAAGYTDVAIFSNDGRIPITSETSPDEARAVADTARQAGLAPSMLICSVKLDGSVDEGVADHCRLIDATAAAGIPWLMNCGTAAPDTYDPFREIMRQCAPYAQDRGVALSMKPHGGIGLTGKMMTKTFELVNHPNFSICYDPGNIIYYTRGEHRPETDVADVAPHVGICIIKDCVVVDDKPDVQVLPGEGWVDFPSVLSQLVAAGFTGPLYVECLGGTELEDVNARAARTHAFVTEIIVAL
jgi:sugar phosphate isomerase/epimerase